MLRAGVAQVRVSMSYQSPRASQRSTGLTQTVCSTKMPASITPNTPRKIMLRRGKVRKRFISWSVRVASARKPDAALR